MVKSDHLLAQTKKIAMLYQQRVCLLWLNNEYKAEVQNKKSRDRLDPGIKPGSNPVV